MSTIKNLGAVIKKHDSGNVETNKGHIVQGKYEIGDCLLLDEKRKVSVKEKRQVDSPEKKNKETASKKIDNASSKDNIDTTGTEDKTNSTENGEQDE